MAKDSPEKKTGASPKPEPQGSRRSERRIFGREIRRRQPRGQQYIFVGLAILFLVAWLMFRQGCSKRIGQTFGTFTGQPARAAARSFSAILSNRLLVSLQASRYPNS